ncbi:MAG: hypothetical protein ACOYJ2_00515 [Rickettsiales bacterium]
MEALQSYSISPSTEPFATFVAAFKRDRHDPETALQEALREMAASLNSDMGNAPVLYTPESILQQEAIRHGFDNARHFREALLPAIEHRALQFCAQDLFAH